MYGGKIKHENKTLLVIEDVYQHVPSGTLEQSIITIFVKSIVVCI